MTERNYILALTRIAFLNAITLSFLSVQFVMPLAFVLFLWIIPTIFALKTYYIPLKLTLLSNLVIVGLSFVLFGIDVGFWTVVYVSAGSVLGIGRRFRYHWIIRFLSAGLTFMLSLLAILAIFTWFAQISWQEIKSMLEALTLFNQIPLIPTMVVGLITWTMILSVTVDWFLSRVLRQVHMGVS